MSRRLEKHVEADIIRDLRRMGFAVTKTSQHGKPQGMTVGIPDLYVQHPVWNVRLWIEVKRDESEQPSTAQAAWHATERAAGGIVVVARSTADLILTLRQLGAPIQA